VAYIIFLKVGVPPLRNSKFATVANNGDSKQVQAIILTAICLFTTDLPRISAITRDQRPFLFVRTAKQFTKIWCY